MAKKILMMKQAACPYCRAAEKMIAKLQEQDPRYRALDIERVDENERPDFAATLDYWYVPTFFVDGVKLHEGAATEEKVKAVLDAALAE